MKTTNITNTTTHSANPLARNAATQQPTTTSRYAPTLETTIERLTNTSSPDVRHASATAPLASMNPITQHAQATADTNLLLRALGEWLELTSGYAPQQIVASPMAEAALAGDIARVNAVMMDSATHDGGELIHLLDQTNDDGNMAANFALRDRLITAPVNARISIYAAAARGHDELLSHIKDNPRFPVAAPHIAFYEMAGAIAGGHQDKLKALLNAEATSPFGATYEDTRPVNLSILAMSFAARLGNRDAVRVLFEHENAAVGYFGPSALDIAAEHGHAQIVSDLLNNPRLYLHGAIPSGIDRERVLLAIGENKIDFDVRTVLHQELESPDVCDALAHRHEQSLKGLSTMMHNKPFQRLSEDQQLSIALNCFGNGLFPKQPMANRAARIMALIQNLNQRVS